MPVTVRLFAGLRERAGWSRRELEGVVRVGDVWPALDLGDERVELRDLTRGQNLCREREENIRIVVTSFVRNDCEHSLAGFNILKRLRDDFRQLRV